LFQKSTSRFKNLFLVLTYYIYSNAQKRIVFTGDTGYIAGSLRTLYLLDNCSRKRPGAQNCEAIRPVKKRILTHFVTNMYVLLLSYERLSWIGE